eukprot:m.15772 g.15772  ORF g.15772 m.15772 type:complete len:218 (-) comp5480_c0_seq1:392-1045(-)
MTEGMSKRERELHLQHLVDTTHFDYEELKLLLDMFDVCCVSKGDKNFIARQEFRDILSSKFEMCDDLIMDRVFHSFSSQQEFDAKITSDVWITGLSVFLRGKLDEQTDFCFRVYDIDRNNEISREVMYNLLSNAIVKSLTEEDKDEAIRDLVEIVLKKMDVSTPKSQTSKISKEDFASAVKQDNLLLQVFGRCLPTPQQAKEFVSLKSLQSIKELFK